MGRSFSGEYRNLVGGNIPYRNFGFNSLQDFLEDAKQVCRVSFGPDGSAVVHGIASDETLHIQELVKRQRSVARKPKPQRKPLMGQQWQPPTPTNFSNHSVAGFRHGFRSVHLPAAQNGFRPMMPNNRYNPDQVNKKRPIDFLKVSGFQTRTGQPFSCSRNRIKEH